MVAAAGLGGRRRELAPPWPPGARAAGYRWLRPDPGGGRIPLLPPVLHGPGDSREGAERHGGRHHGLPAAEVGGDAAAPLPAVLGARSLGGALLHRGLRLGGATAGPEAVRPCSGGRLMGG